MRRWIAHRVCRALIEQDPAGSLVRPGGVSAQRWVQPDGTEAAMVARGDGFDLYIGKSTIYNVTLSTETALAMMRWLFRWWAISTWFGLKHRLWYWALGVMLEHPEKNEQRTQVANLGR